MKVLIWNTNFLRDGGGSQKVTHYLACDLHELGIQTTVACNRVSTPKRNLVFGELPTGVTLYQDTFLSPWEASEEPSPLILRIFSYFSAAFRFILFVRKERFSLIHLNYVSWDVVLLSSCCALMRVPLVLSFLGGERHLARQRALTKIKVRLGLRYADRVTAVTKNLCDELNHEFGFRDARHIPFFRDPSAFLVSECIVPSEFEEDQFVFCGRVSPEKRVLFLIEAFHEATRRGCSRKLYIIGRGADLPECRQLVRAFKLDERVIFLEWLPHHLVQQVFRTCRCVILCSRTESNPQVLLEAMSFERPVICSELPGVRHLVLHEETGLVFEMSRKDVLVDLILKVSRDRDFARRLGRSAGAHVKRLFSGHSYGEQMVAVYSELYQRKPP